LESSDFNDLANRGKVMLGEWQTKPSKWRSYGWFYRNTLVETYHKSATQKPKSLILLYRFVNQRGLHCHYAQHNFTIKILTMTSEMTRFQRKSRPEGRLSCGLLDVFDDVPDRLG
jgi:hypothetical protein